MDTYQVLRLSVSNINMKSRSSHFLSYILVFISFVTTGILLAQTSHPEQDTQDNLITANIAKYDNLPINHDDPNRHGLYSEPSRHFEPFLLLLLGTVLLSVVACINVVRSRGLNLHFHSSSQKTGGTESIPSKPTQES